MKNLDKVQAISKEYRRKNRERLNRNSNKLYYSNEDILKTEHLLRKHLRDGTFTSSTILERTGFDVIDFGNKIKELNNGKFIHKGFSFYGLGTSQGKSIYYLIIQPHLIDEVFFNLFLFLLY